MSSISAGWRTPALRGLAPAAALLAGLAVGGLTLTSGVPDAAKPYRLTSIEECIGARAKLVGKPIDDLATVEKIGTLCYAEIRNQGLLNDFQMRRGKFLYQDYANYVVLWMVVAITLSGVLLAGLQLVASYNLSLARNLPLAGDSELTWKNTGDVALKSSVTGLFILMISFAFFLVFVMRVYEIREVSVDGKPDGKAEVRLPMGAYGPAP